MQNKRGPKPKPKKIPADVRTELMDTIEIDVLFLGHTLKDRLAGIYTDTIRHNS